MYILALADDMTGALEIGSKFSAAGLHTIVSAKPGPHHLATVVVFDTETRHLHSDEAAKEVRRFVLASAAVNPRLIYKKTDSTLRGNITAELEALAELYPDWSIGYAPAYPALKRTVQSGVLYVDGIALAETAFAHDALNPVSDSRVSALLNPKLPCTIFDGEVEADLVNSARAILGHDTMRIAAGPAGLAEMIAREIDVSRDTLPMLPRVRTCLVFNGSRHECSATQMLQAAAAGWTLLERDHQRDANAAAVAKENAEYVVREIAARAPDAVFIVGGDTAFAVVRELGLPPLLPIAEAVPGVPVTCIEARHLAHILPKRKADLYLITKAGGFGEPDVFAQVRARLKNDE
jgi:uncharacterized protein YgbK (DUF1537 family)